MQKEGLELFFPMERFQVMGFSQVIRILPQLYFDLKKISTSILHKNPAAVVLIDYADFNMQLAHILRKKGYGGKIFHYVCPSVWAWRKNRVAALAKTLDHLLCILPFEKSYFETTTLALTYVGHPLVSLIDHYAYDPRWNIKKGVVALFPGSRSHEIELNLPLQLAAAKKLGLPIAVSIARPSLESLIRRYVDETVELVPFEKRYELMRTSSCAIATSGTVILELGLHSVPTVATYQLTTFNYLLGRYFFKIRLPFYTLVNIICGKAVFPEFIHKKISSEEVAQALKHLLENPEECQQHCLHLRSLLTRQEASSHAASVILKEICP